MSNLQNLVRAFHEKFRLTIGERPAIRDGALRIELIREEFEEFKKAVKSGDLVASVDGLADLLYVVYGAGVAFGVDLEPVLAVVHRANMAKEGGALRDDGKLLKPDGWQPPDVRGELLRQGWGDLCDRIDHFLSRSAIDAEVELLLEDVRDALEYTTSFKTDFSERWGQTTLSGAAISVQPARNQEIRPTPIDDDEEQVPAPDSPLNGYEAGQDLQRFSVPDGDVIVLPWDVASSIYDTEGPKNWPRCGVVLDIAEGAGPSIEVRLAPLIAPNTGRERFLVYCEECKHVVHRGTTGPRSRVASHLREAHGFEGTVILRGEEGA